MRVSIQVALIVGASLFSAGCNSDSGSDVPAPSELDAKTNDVGRPPVPEAADDTAQNDTVVGGYTKAPVESADVIAAAKFAIAEESKKGSVLALGSIDSAESQVVAGMNFRLRLTVNDAGTMKTAEAIVYQDLKQTLSLTSWEWK